MTSAPVPNTPRPSPAPSSPEQRRSMSGKTITALILLAISLAFVFSNLNQGTIMFLGFRFVMPVWIWFLGVLLMGVVIGSLFPWFRGRRKKK
ncbi:MULTISPECIES: hypothetical protein [unclassified Leucobacter]|uniref:hypothetical protein n=1 Tax=unclassified Leucobacter TaxID=2621730 RepID=UPI00165D4D7A|nr:MULTISPECIES: hypothetical protein [unclassified Leucobacter]MBC9926779.1 hypothetical protein [Leucobacter sp. cx-169]MBC9935259.1 hypothetical protein [Leucobacter sp. cx-87]